MGLSNLNAVFFFSSANGILSAYLAYKQKRNPVLWFFIGFFFGMLGTFILFFAVNSRKIAEKPVKMAPQPYLLGPTEKFWYYVDSSNNSVGPMSYAAIFNEWKRGNLSNKTLVWHEELTEWQELGKMIVNSQKTF